MTYLYLFILLCSTFTFAAETCSPSSVTINLEEEVPYPGAPIRGPLYGVPQDNQDGIGTCYANVSRYVLLGLSGGRDSASYLDLALGFKRTSNDLTEEGLSAGEICPTLMAARQRGFCPQNLAPLEGSGRTEIARVLGVENDPFRAQSDLNNALRDFFARRQSMTPAQVSASILPRIGEAIRRVRENPMITFPFPGMSVPFVNTSIFKGVQLPENSKDTAESLYESALSTIRPQTMQAIIENKTPGEIFDIFSRGITPTFRRMHIEDQLPGQRTSFIEAMTAAMNAPGFRDRITATLEFLRGLSGRSENSPEQFAAFCTGEYFPNIELLNSIGPVLRTLSASDGSIVDSQGNLLPMADVFQLAVAPACLNPQNRRPTSVNFTCDDRFFDSIRRSRVSIQTKMTQVRTRLIQNLRQGIPVGRAFPQPGGGGHVNTIVGFRYNSDRRECEYLIRDSASAESNWHSEREVVSESDGMSFASRAP